MILIFRTVSHGLLRHGGVGQTGFLVEYSDVDDDVSDWDAHGSWSWGFPTWTGPGSGPSPVSLRAGDSLFCTRSAPPAHWVTAADGRPWPR